MARLFNTTFAAWLALGLGIAAILVAPPGEAKIPAALPIPVLA
jgi:hypothetical protein